MNATERPVKTVRAWLETRNRTEIARRMGVDPSTVHRLFRGTQRPSAETIFALARVLEIDPSQIVLDHAA